MLHTPGWYALPPSPTTGVDGMGAVVNDAWTMACSLVQWVSRRRSWKSLLPLDYRGGVDVAAELARQGITVRAQRPDLLAEEAALAYKDVVAVVEVAAGAGLIRPVARMRPLVVIKG
jgi:hypothetical protein